MITKRLPERNAERPYWRPISLLGRGWRRMNITTDGHHVRATGCSRCSDISRLPDRAIHEGAGERKRAWIYMVWITISWEAYKIDTRSYMIDHHRQLWYQEQKLQSITGSQARFIRADRARIWPPKQLPKPQNDHWWAGPADMFTRNWERSSASALECIVRMTSYWDACKLDIPMQLPMVMAMWMVMMSSERMPPSMVPSRDEAHTMIGDIAEITVSKSDNERHLIQVRSARLDGRMPDIPEVGIWRMVSLWMFLLSLFFSSVYFFTSLFLWISAQYKWRQHGFLLPLEISQVEV